MSDYKKYKESHLKAQKKYDEKHKVERKERDKKRYNSMKKCQKEIEILNNIIERINSIYKSMQFSAPENQYIFINQLGEVLEELKGSEEE